VCDSALGAGLTTPPLDWTVGLSESFETCGPRSAGSGDPRTARPTSCSHLTALRNSKRFSNPSPRRLAGNVRLARLNNKSDCRMLPELA